MQVADHGANDRQLLVIFFAKIGRVGADDVEQFGYHSRDAAVVSGPDQPVQHMCKVGCLDDGFVAVGVNFTNAGDENGGHAGLF